MLKSLFACLLVCISSLYGFSQGQPISPENHILKTPSGFEYEWNRKSVSSESISAYDYVFINMTLTVDDSVLQSTHKPTVIRIFADNNNYGQLKPLVDLMATLHVGDSV